MIITGTKNPMSNICLCIRHRSLVSPVSLSLLETLVIFPRSANINHHFTATLCTAASRCVGKIPLFSERWPHRVQNNSIHVITIDASENEIKISRLNIHWYIYPAFTIRCERQVVLRTTIGHFLVVRHEWRLSAKNYDNIGVAVHLICIR